jgi:hypothetical protein
MLGPYRNRQAKIDRQHIAMSVSLPRQATFQAFPPAIQSAEPLFRDIRQLQLRNLPPAPQRLGWGLLRKHSVAMPIRPSIILRPFNHF